MSGSEIADHLLEGLQLIGPDFRYLYVNDAVAAHGRTTKDALLGRTMMEAYPGIEETAMFGVLRRCMVERCPARLENEFEFGDGSRGWFELRLEPVPEGVAILSVDITERKLAEDRLRRSARALATLSRCNKALVYATEEHPFMEEICRLVVETAGYAMAWIGLTGDGDDRLRVAARAIASGLPPDSRVASVDDGYSPTRDAIRSARTVVGRPTPRSAAGSAALDAEAGEPAACIALPLFDDAGCIGVLTIHAWDPTAFDADERAVLDEVALDLGHGIGTLRNRSVGEKTQAELAQSRLRRREMEEQLRTAQRLDAIGRLAGGVAHDFNNLLSVILSYTGFALEDLVESDPIRSDIAAAHEAAIKAGTLTRQLLAFSRRQPLAAAVTSWAEVVGDMESMLRRLLREDIEIAIRAAPDLGHVLADPTQLEQVVMNLVVNARDALPRGGKLTVEMQNVDLDAEYAAEHFDVRPGEYVMLAVTDTGTGMTPETRRQVFEPFFTTKAETKGTGLGLSTVYGIVKQSGGHIWLYSEPGRGTTFKIYLPRVYDKPAQDEVARPSRSAQGEETVLVVEDEPAVREAARRILEKAGYTVLQAGNGDEGIAAANRHDGRVDLVLTDLVMPRMGGDELASRLRQSHPSLRVLFMSGHSSDGAVHNGLLSVDGPFLSKPFSAGGLREKVREVLDGLPYAAPDR